MKFEIGKAYQHNSGIQIFICGMADTIFHGTCFIGERGWNRELLKVAQHHYDYDKGLKSTVRPGSEGWADMYTPISMTDDAMENWFEITKEEFIKNNTSE